ncbi:MAG: PilZ domain-containing protein [Spirochaetales bacterium]|nr:PilZ domain-containing protein [Spirochaetales bacterium]
MKEKRSIQRVEFPSDFKNSTDIIAVKDVSEHGICVIMNEPYDVGRYFSRSFLLPSGAGINILGKVMWQKIKKHNEYETGIQFISLGSADREHLMRYIKNARK